MLKFIKKFRKDEDGAATVDWVVLTAAVIGIGGVAVSAVNGAIGDATTNIKTEISAKTKPS